MSPPIASVARAASVLLFVPILSPLRLVEALAPTAAPTSSLVPTLIMESDDTDHGEGMKCDVYDITGCSDGFQNSLIWIVVIMWIAFLAGMNELRLKALLFEGMKPNIFKHKPNAPQIMVMCLPISNFFVALGTTGQLIATFTNPTDENPASPLFGLLFPLFAIGIGATLVVLVVLLYILFWLQVLEIKKKQYEAKAAAEKGEAPPTLQIKIGPDSDETPDETPGKKKKNKKGMTEEKAKAFTKQVLYLAKNRKKIVRAMERGCIVVAILQGVLSVTGTFLNGDIRHYMAGVQWMLLAMELMPPIYVLSTMGNAQVMLYNYKPITIQFYVISYGICAIVAMMLMHGAMHFFVSEEVSETMHLICLWVVAVVVVAIPFLIGMLMNIPLRAAKKKKYGKKGTDTGTGTGATLETQSSELRDGTTDAAVAAKKQRKIRSTFSVSSVIHKAHFGKSKKEAPVAPGLTSTAEEVGETGKDTEAEKKTAGGGTAT
mmetsp:Transcript_32311/g.74698  ORF Transcript_32311/g.74698 Transcript_32311/m.74698 type:complete len:489 (-) Transcript_32311:275-1741(-)